MSLSAWIPQRLVQAAEQRYRRQPDPEKRLGLARLCARIFPRDPYFYELMAYAWLDHRPSQPKEAFEALKRASRLNPTNALYPKKQADILLAEGRWDEASALAAKALDLEPNYQGARLLRAEILARLGRKEAAEEELATALRRRLPLSRAEAHCGYDRSIFAFDQGRYEAALRLVRQGQKKKVE